MKKWIAVLICALMMLGLAGCGASSGQAEAPAPEAPAEEAPAPEAPAAEDAAAEPPAEEDAAAEPPAEEDAAAEPPAEEDAAAEPPAEEDASAANETSADEIERVVADSFRFMVPVDWEKQENGSYIAKDGVLIFFFGVPVKGDAYQLPEGITVQDPDFPEEFVACLNERGLYENMILELPESDTAAHHHTQESSAGLTYRRMHLSYHDKTSGETAGICSMDVYEWDRERFFMILYDSYRIASANECSRIINRTIERIG